ncbi:sporulation protein YqfC [Clostridium moutaii]
MNNTKQNIADKLDLPRDIILNMPQIKVMGNNEIIIENHKGIILFEDSQIKINSGIGLISIYGSKFEVLFIGGSTITVGGRFKSIVYEGN